MFKASSNLIKWFLEALSVKSPPAKILLAFKESNKKERRIRRKTSLSLIWTQYTVCAITHIYTKPWNSRIQSNISYKPHSWYLPKHLFLFKQRNKNNFQVRTREKWCKEPVQIPLISRRSTILFSLFWGGIIFLKNRKVNLQG